MKFALLFILVAAAACQPNRVITVSSTDPVWLSEPTITHKPFVLVHGVATQVQGDVNLPAGNCCLPLPAPSTTQP